MEKRNDRIIDARKRIAAMTEIARWLWSVNAIVMIVAFYYGRYELAALAGFTWLMSLAAAAMGRRAVERLGTDERLIRSP